MVLTIVLFQNVSKDYLSSRGETEVSVIVSILLITSNTDSYRSSWVPLAKHRPAATGMRVRCALT